ncbi:TPA: hypothetical protein EYO12_02650 [Candidatus Saccharibacteria bacterium]|nr:hypothetical protein [Candidatus Saccharibacteria bacterium]HIO88061.1 hypothetical protein [Candidatus Saccharibacteria bacterium]
MIEKAPKTRVSLAAAMLVLAGCAPSAPRSPAEIEALQYLAGSTDRSVEFAGECGTEQVALTDDIYVTDQNSITYMENKIVSVGSMIIAGGITGEITCTQLDANTARLTVGNFGLVED